MKVREHSFGGKKPSKSITPRRKECCDAGINGFFPPPFVANLSGVMMARREAADLAGRMRTPYGCQGGKRRSIYCGTPSCHFCPGLTSELSPVPASRFSANPTKLAEWTGGMGNSGTGPLHWVAVLRVPCAHPAAHPAAGCASHRRARRGFFFRPPRRARFSFAQ